MNTKVNSAAIALVFAFSATASADVVLFADDFEAAPNPVNLYYGPGGAIASGTWGMAGTGPVDETVDSSVNTYNNAANWAGPLPASNYLQLGFAQLDATEPTIALDETWDSSKDYRLSFDLANRDHAVSTVMNLEVNFTGVPLQFYSGGYYLTPYSYWDGFPVLGSPNFAEIKKVDLEPLHNTFTSKRLELVVTGAEIAAAGQHGNQIYFSFDKGWNSEHHYIDNVEFVEIDFTNYCFGDGSGTSCPCANTSGADEGCANSSGAGAALTGAGSTSAATDDVSFTGAGLLPGQPALLFVGDNAVNGGSGLLFGDGLRCAGGTVVRLGVQVPDAGGVATWGPGLASTGGWGAGDTRRFQAWYRDPVGSPCGAGFNLSNGVEVSFQ